jgi:D-sedoheptulose 7-phosphate isomerase
LEQRLLTFPDTKFLDITTYSHAYFEHYAEAASSINQTKLAEAANVLLTAYKNLNTLYVCGNGGSASISNHLACDHGKLLATDTDLQPRIQSLSTNIEVITAIANDISYDQIFVHQLKLIANPGDVVMTVSSSGDSENVVLAAKWAREFGLDVIAMTGFSGGRTAKIASVNLHVNGDNYGIIEDVHQSLMHLLGQYLRQSLMDENLVQERKF